jgi:hypothetical protein
MPEAPRAGLLASQRNDVDLVGGRFRLHRPINDLLSGDRSQIEQHAEAVFVLSPRADNRPRSLCLDDATITSGGKTYSGKVDQSLLAISRAWGKRCQSHQREKAGSANLPCRGVKQGYRPE